MHSDFEKLENKPAPVFNKGEFHLGLFCQKKETMTWILIHFRTEMTKRSRFTLNPVCCPHISSMTISEQCSVTYKMITRMLDGSTATFELTLTLFFSSQRGSIGLCGWSSPYLPPPTLQWLLEKSSSWTRASRNRHSSTPSGSTETETRRHRLDCCCCRLQSTCWPWLLTVVSVFKCITV